MLKKILYISYFFPPANEIASVRSKNTYKYLLKNGWEVDVLTKFSNEDKTNEFVKYRINNSNVMYVEDPLSENFYKNSNLFYKILRRIYVEIFGDIGYHWCRKAYKKINEQSKKYDIVLATGGPFTTFRLAKKVSERNDIPYVLDYRDLWYGNPHLRRFFSRKWEEKKLVDRSSWVFTVSKSCAEKLVDSFSCGGKISVLTNGFDEFELSDILISEKNEKFNVVYAGTFYPPLRVPDPLFKAISLLSDEVRGKIVFNYYGPHGDIVQGRADKFSVLDNIVLNGPVSRSISLVAQKNADLVLVVSTVNSKSSLAEKGVLTGKIFESIGLEKPILAICPEDSDMHDLVTENSFGYSFSGDHVYEISECLRKLSSADSMAINFENKNKFSWCSIVLEISSRLKKILE